MYISKNLITEVGDCNIIKNNLKSDHAPIAVTLQVDTCEYIIEELIQRSSTFMDYQHLEETERRTKLRATTTNKAVFVQSMGIPDCVDRSCDNMLSYINDNIIKHATAARDKSQNNKNTNRIPYHNRWLNIPLKDIWLSIGWNGLIENKTFDKKDQPSPQDFKCHYEVLLNIAEASEQLNTFQYNEVPINQETDQVFEYNEVEEAINMKDKSNGPDGVPPGLMKYLPFQWIVFILNLFNSIFLTGKFPYNWIFSTLASIHKGGPKKNCSNYRGICMIDAILKVYDKVLVRRLTKWWKPAVEQIGNQPKHSCIDHLTTLHILINISRTSKKKLFILFVDFSKAYDRVSRYKLLELLKKAGCGRILLRAIFLMYKTTKILYENITICTNTGVKQGSPSSGFLFTFFINPLVSLLKELGADSFLEDLHCLLMMDDSVIMATSREKLEEKIEVLLKFCNDYGMVVNELKTKYMIINHESEDKINIDTPAITIKYTNEYIYLGACITDDGNIMTVMEKHSRLKNPHFLKFTAFIKKNEKCPFHIKRQVFRACMLSTILYSCEVWYSTCIHKKLSTMYLACVKALLGVRKQTDNDLSLQEIMMPSLEALVHDIQLKYYSKINDNKDEYQLLNRVMEMGRNVQLQSGHTTKCKTMKHIDKMLERNNKRHIIDDMDDRKARILISNKSKTLLYRQWSHNLTTHEVYITRKYYPECWRIAWTRFRLGSTNLPCEKSRWSRGNHETRCKCGDIQTEHHIITSCKDKVIPNAMTVKELFNAKDQKLTMKYIYDTLQKFENNSTDEILNLVT